MVGFNSQRTLLHSVRKFYEAITINIGPLPELLFDL